jgi:hypothetical protein
MVETVIYALPGLYAPKFGAREEAMNNIPHIKETHLANPLLPLALSLFFH